MCLWSLSVRTYITYNETIQPIDTSKSIVQKMAESLVSRGIKDPNDRPNIRRRQNTLAQFVFGGSREWMLNLAFGSQEVSFEKGADNSHLCRTRDIEDCAKDDYGFVVKCFGEDNIVGFSVRLQPMQNHVAVAVHLALVGDVTRMKTMIIGGAGALQYRLR